MISMKIQFADIIALIALLISIYSIYKTIQFNKRQNEFAKTANHLNKLLVEKENLDIVSKKKADISANFIHPGKNKYRLKVYNKGAATAKNVRIDFPDGNTVLSNYDVNSKFPVEIMEQFHSIELIASIHMQSPRKLTVKLTWDDDFKLNNEKILTPVIS